MYDQARKIIDRFGGARRLAKAIGVDPVNVYRWSYPRNRGGTDGVIPSANIPFIVAAARLEGILLQPGDWVPEVIGADPADIFA